MPAEERDRLYRERFDQIDTNHDGTLDAQERAAWREKQRENYRQQAAERARPAAGSIRHKVASLAEFPCRFPAGVLI